MNSDNQYNEELNPDFNREAPILSSIKKENPFVVPQNYFESLPENILKKIESLPDFESVASENPFAVPANYFEALPDEVMSSINSLPDFESVAKENPFAVPANYFESLPTIIQQRIADEKANRINVREWIASILFKPQYSLAFASIALIAVFGTKYITRTINVESTSNQISYADISNSRFMNDIDESTLMDALNDQNTSVEPSDQSLENYLIDNNIDDSQLSEKL